MINKRGLKNRLSQLQTRIRSLENEVCDIIGDIDRELDVQQKLEEEK